MQNSDLMNWLPFNSLDGIWIESTPQEIEMEWQEEELKNCN